MMDHDDRIRSNGRQAGRRASSSNLVRKRKKWTRKGVSEIIGNLLILAITVTLFTSILYFVSSMPGPAEKVYTDFSSNVALNPNGTAWVNMTHKGGETLGDFKTNIYLFQDNQIKVLHIKDGIAGSQDWRTGATWSYLASGVWSNTSLSVMVVDTAANTVVYEGKLLGGSQAAMSLPIIGDRGMNPTPTYEGNKVQFYAVVTNPYGALDTSSVRINATSIGLGTIVLTDPDHDNTYTSDPLSKPTAALLWNGATVIISAADTAGQRSEARMVLSVLPAVSGGGGSGPYQDYTDYLTIGTYPPDASGGESGGEAGTTFYYVRRASDNVITRNFTTGEQVLVEIWSDTMMNTALSNFFYLYHPISGEAITPQTTDNAFQYAGSFSTFRKFVYTFTAPDSSYIYPIQVKLKDNMGVLINIADTISVNGGDYPKLETYKAVDGKLVKSCSFNHTDTVYLIIRTKNVDLSAQTVYVSDIQVADYTGSYIIQKAPPAWSYPPTYNDASKPISSVFKTNGISEIPLVEPVSGGVYTIKIVLKDAYQGWWLPKTNDYTLKISTVMDQGTEGTGDIYHSLSCQLQVTAPVSTTDILASLGTGSFTWSASGATWDDSKVVWFRGGDQWDYTTIDDNPSQGPISLALADINGDGKNDVVVGSQDPNYDNIVWYENQKVDGSMWSSARSVCSPFDALPNKQASTTSNSWPSYQGSSNKGNANEDVTIWSTQVNSFVTYRSGSEYTATNEICGPLAVADLDLDGDGDIIASFIHVVIWTTAESPSDADYTNSFAMYFNRGIYVFWNDGSWTKTPLESTMDWVSTSSANMDSNPAAMDLDIADFNRDGYMDVVAVYQNGITKVWLNQWSSQTGTILQRENGAFGSNSLRSAIPTVPGYDQWAYNSISSTSGRYSLQYTAQVEAEDMNGDGYSDIVRTSTKDRVVYIFYTVPSGLDQITTWPSAEGQINATCTAQISGSMANLVAADGIYEGITEVYVYYAPVNISASSKAGDTTPSPLVNSQLEDGLLYDVPSSSTMLLSGFTPPLQYQTKVLGQAVLNVKYSSDALYAGTAKLQYSIDGVTYYDTTIQPIGGQSNAAATFDLCAAGISDWNGIASLYIRFVNSEVGADKAVRFDYVMVNATFVQTRQAGWMWEIQNNVRAYHNLTMVGHVNGGEHFLIQYSTDNETWFDAATFTSTTDETKYSWLYYTPNSRYYIRVLDANSGVDTTNDTLFLDQLVIRHFAQTVSWDSANTLRITTFTASSPITGLAIGNMKRAPGSYVPGELPDIVVSCAQVDSSNALFILRQGTSGNFAANAVYTQVLDTMCDDGVYDAKAVDLGDTDGDGDLDIIMVVGAAFGRTPGTAPTLWQYNNNQRFESGTWRFTEEPINELTTKGESAINVELGYINLTVFLPLLGVVGIVAASAAVERYSRKRR